MCLNTTVNSFLVISESEQALYFIFHKLLFGNTTEYGKKLTLYHSCLAPSRNGSHLWQILLLFSNYAFIPIYGFYVRQRMFIFIILGPPYWYNKCALLTNGYAKAWQSFMCLSSYALYLLCLSSNRVYVRSLFMCRHTHTRTYPHLCL